MIPRADAASARRLSGIALLLIAAGVVAGTALPAEGAQPAASVDETEPAWSWPLTASRITSPYIAPAGPYGPGHRGIDLLPLDAGAVRAPAVGTVAFSGPVAGRGILTIDHGDGYVTTLEPVDSALSVGTAVRRGEEVASVHLGGHADPGTLHFGVRLHGEYINPLILLGGVPRAVLLPCC